MKKWLLTLGCLLLSLKALAVDTDNMTDEEYSQWAQGIWDKLDRQTGTITLPNGVATLNVPENFYYLSPKDAETVLVDVWGNPPSSELGQGMLFPADVTPFDAESWGVTIDYEEDGYVSDDDAADIDYDDMLADMKKDVAEESKYREKNGYGSVALVGWAEKPYYDASSHKLYWAKEMNFDHSDVNTLNFNIRVLGRKGVLVLNFIASMEQKAEINTNLETVLAIANFDEGSRYQDFNPELDKVAAYGLGGLIAGKVLAKVGFFAAALLLLKKFGVFLLAGLAWLGRKVFSGRKEKTE
ncbi:DUF2167 domain-containing protein [Gallaecimonas xiamenensis]|uniref:Membrane-anchored protein n=1 Tax=Gallaecimonas xiamenensis 3-C-1 TaxID=745411 RepID=K2JZ76_9GAMM|nr:DUF2167 domain-containing protein [Gallaecimonas xiamenensis]EKE70590.1 hypothetical protein B3C1_13668 [Gallaecimonas xiamenensis 3-C-1]